MNVNRKSLDLTHGSDDELVEKRPCTILPMHDPAGFLRSLRQCSGHVAMFEQLQQVDTEQDGWQLPERVHVETDKCSSCCNAISLLMCSQPSVLQNFKPVYVSGDDNCLFRTISVCLYGVEDHHLLLRALTTVEVLSDK